MDGPGAIDGGRIMINPHEFASRQFELTAEFGKWVFDHPEIEATLPDGATVYFEIDGEADFNRSSREQADRLRLAGTPVVLVRVKGLAPPQGSRLIDPVIEVGQVVG